MSVLIIKQGFASKDGTSGVRGKVTGHRHVPFLSGHAQIPCCLPTVSQRPSWVSVKMCLGDGMCSQPQLPAPGWVALALGMVTLVSGTHTSLLFTQLLSFLWFRSFVQMVCAFGRVAFELNSEVFFSLCFLIFPRVTHTHILEKSLGGVGRGEKVLWKKFCGRNKALKSYITCQMWLLHLMI